MMFDACWETRLSAWMMVGSMLVATGCSNSDGGSSSSGGSNGTSSSSGSGGGGVDGGGGLDGGSSSSSSGSSGETTFSCGKAGEFCLEYIGSASSIDAIRNATKCTDQGGVEGTGCVKEGAAVCALPQNGGTGTRGAQYYYGSFDEDDLTSMKATCERSGGTFSAP